MPKTLISLFTGAGGIDYGFEAAGFDVAAAVEMDEDCCRTLKSNRDWPVLCRDIHDTPSEELLEVRGLGPGEVGVVVGGPPCQPFSKSSFWTRDGTRRMKDPRAQTLVAFMRVVEDTLPKAFMLENVHGIAYSGKEEGFQVLRQLTDQINQRAGVSYRLSFQVLNTADFGVPQARRRFFLIGRRDGKEFKFPTPRFADHSNGSEPSLFDSAVEPYRTAWDAIGDLQPDPNEDLSVKGSWAELLPSIPEGENYLWHTDRKGGMPLFGWRTRYWSFLLKLAKDRPSWTIQAQPGPSIGPFHWESRLLSTREMARLQTFPDDVEITGNRPAIQRQLGNAVPSLMAEVLAREISVQVLGEDDRHRNTEPRLLPPVRKPVPEPEPIKPVPKKYHKFKGDHKAHPGTGKGRAARKRKAQAQSDS